MSLRVDLTSTGPVVAAVAHAKVNLYLHVVGRRPDGYHLLDSLIAFAAYGDRIEVRPSEQLSLRVTGPFAGAVPGDQANLVLQAAHALAEAAKVSAGAEIHLVKNLPVASGIGGGSADAAAALRALVQLWQVALPASQLADLALALGADVPICLVGRPAFVGGIGERIDPAPALPACWLVLANPLVPLPTPDVFRRRRGSFATPARFIEPPADVVALAHHLASRGNSLTAAAIGLLPVIDEVLNALAALPGALLARMSGSGGTCFALFASEEAAAAGADALEREHPAWWIVPSAVAASSEGQ